MRKFIYRLSLFSFVFFTLTNYVQAQQIAGTITDNETGEPLYGCTITLFQNAAAKQNILSGLNGGFIIKNMAAGNYSLHVKYVGYNEKDTPISVDKGNEKFNVHLQRNTTAALSEVTVITQHNNGSDRSAFLADRISPNIQNSVSARTIEISPDLSVANVTQRVLGISLERSTNGEGQYAIVRGMDKRYNYTLVNGIKIPSPDNRNRYIPLDIFPADLLDRLEVTKVLTPNMEGDAIGGVVNMIMKDAPARFMVNANAALGYSGSLSDRDFNTFDKSASLNHSPRYRNGNAYNATLSDLPNNPFTYSAKNNPLASLFNLALGGRILNNKLGVLVAGSYQNNYRNVNSIFFGTETDRNTGAPQLTDVQWRNYSIQQQRTGLNAKLDYRINETNSLNLYAGYFNLARNEYRYASDTNLVLGRTVAGSGRVENSYRTYHDEQQISNITLNGKHTLFDKLDINWSAVYSKATDNRPDEATLNLVTGVSVDPTTGKLVEANLNLDQYSYREWQYNSDKDKSGYLNLTYKSLFGKVKAAWSLGGMYRNKKRTSNYDSYTLRPDPGIQTYNGDIAQNTFYIFNPQGNATNPLNYDATENVGAAYAMLHLTFNKLQLTGGARYENTDLKWNSAVPETVDGKTGSVTYYDVLPSAAIKYSVTSKQDIRLSYYSAISRPNFYEIIPHIGGDPEADYQERGNPYLKRTTAENYDIRYEIFTGGLDQILVGAFYKQLKNPIEFALEDVGTNTYYQPDNFGTAHNYGFEADITKYFRWLGIRANYTFTDSKITTAKYQRLSTNAGQTALLVDQTRPLQGQSKHIANFSLLYKDDKVTGLNAQLAFTYTSRRINTVSQYLNDDIWQKGFAQMDFSVEKRLTKKWFVYGKINNLLNTPFKLEIPVKNSNALIGVPPYQKGGENILVRKDTYGANYLAGVKFKM